MRNKLRPNAVFGFLRIGLLGILVIGVANAQNSSPAPSLPSASTNPPNSTGEVRAVSKTGNEDAARKQTDEASARWGFRSAIVAAIASIVAAIITWLNSQKTARLTARLNSIGNLQTEYDKDLRNRRIEHYQRLMAWMVNLPKYPKPEPLTVEGLRHLSLAFRDWYFVGGGGFFCRRTKTLRNSQNPPVRGILIFKKAAK